MGTLTGCRPEFRLDRERLGALAATHGPGYREARPFAHAVIDDFLPEWAADAVLAEFPGPSDIPWDHYDDWGNTRKLATSSPDLIPPFTRGVLAELNAAVMIDFLEALTGLVGLVPDPHLLGGGLHQIERGGFLNVHADFNLHPRLRLHRRLNLLLYLNRGWAEAHGGHLELWSADMLRCERRILPVFNRCVVFDTSDTSYHGHPQPLPVQAPRTRKSIGLYYYSATPPPTGGSAEHSTLYQVAPRRHDRSRIRRRLALRLLPPLVADRMREVRRVLDSRGHR